MVDSILYKDKIKAIFTIIKIFYFLYKIVHPIQGYC